MEYTKDVILNVQYGQAIKLKEKKFLKKLVRAYNDNRFIINTLVLTTTLVIVDVWMVSSFINLLLTL